MAKFLDSFAGNSAIAGSLTKHRWLFITFAMFAASYFIEWGMAYRELHRNPLRLVWIMRTAIDALLLYLPLLILPRRWQPIILLVVWLTPLFLYVNILYLRFFGDFMPLYVFRFTGNFDPVTFRSARILLRPLDCIFALIPLSVTLIYMLWLRRKVNLEPPLTSRARWRWLGAMLLILIFGQSMTFISHTQYGRSLDPGWSWRDTFTWRYLKYPPDNQTGQIIDKGLPCYILTTLLQEALCDNGHITLDESQRARIDEFITRSPRCTHSLLEANRGKNLILIIVESLNSWAVGMRVGDFEVTPVLSRLLSEEGTVFNLNVVTQVAAGISSDGQLLYNTGLLPLRHAAVSMTFTDIEYPSLAKELEGYSSVEIHPVSRALWNIHTTHRLAGYSSLHAINEVKSAIPDFDSRGTDASMFAYALSTLPILPEPFIAELVTVSTHPPFDEPAIVIPAPIASDNSLSDTHRRYLAAVNYFDRSLGIFLDGLKEKGLYDNSVVVIAADHDVKLDIDHGGPSNGFIPFIALNTGTTACIDRISGQIDVYPTILDLMGIEPRWKGLGTSMLCPELNSAVDRWGAPHGNPTDKELRRQSEAWDVSEEIIRGNYFATPR